jgi:hypothetical protein
MNRTSSMIVLSFVLLTLSGCGPAGSWKLDSVSPSEAAERYHLADFTLYNDKTYSATIDLGQGPMPSRGTWTFSDDTLTFNPDDGSPSRSYQADLKAFGQKMEIVTSDRSGSKVTAVMKRK